MENKKRCLLRGVIFLTILLLLEYIYQPYIHQKHIFDYHIYELLYGFLFVLSARSFYLSMVTKKQTLIQLISFIGAGLLFGVAYSDLYIFLGVSIASATLLFAYFFLTKK